MDREEALPCRTPWQLRPDPDRTRARPHMPITTSHRLIIHRYYTLQLVHMYMYERLLLLHIGFYFKVRSPDPAGRVLIRTGDWMGSVSCQGGREGAVLVARLILHVRDSAGLASPESRVRVIAHV